MTIQRQQSTILIVDDNIDNLNLLFNFLMINKFKVLIKQSGESALKFIELINPYPDLILLDVMMPGLDGFETCRRLKNNEKTRDIPIIFMTALSNTLDKIKAFELGAVDYVTKPFRQEEVLVRINTHLTLHQLQQQLIAKNTELEKQHHLALQLNVKLQRKNKELEQLNATLKKEIQDRQRAEIALENVQQELLILGNFSKMSKK
ncbi:response regulator [Candidatus Parabeggiatoa sp. HSG14]|uniref:response regulator n=1 Tax=Candidatus Parabeggiatoa sp. HSG14 TaxID=3055593 RepID=UPI0025A7CC02|nr:response regulator [Thiotrichales bacterium HSG14]